MNHCAHCQIFIDGVGVGEKVHRQDMASYPPDLQREWDALSALILQIAGRFPGQLRFRITDAQSPRGLWWALRGVRRYPTFIVAGERYTGLEEAPLAALITRHLPEQVT